MLGGRTIGVLTPLVAGPYFGGVLTGIAREAAAAGSGVVVVQTLDPVLGDAHLGVPLLSARVAWGRVAGFVVVTGAVSDDYLVRLHETGCPVVLVSHEVAGLALPRVAPDNRAGVRAAVAHLYAHGHRRIAFAGHLAQADFRERYETYRDALHEHGLDVQDDLFFETGDSMAAGGERAGHRMIECGLPLTAVLAGNDNNAVGISRVLRSAGYRLPEDMAVIGFDDTSAAEHQAPSLTSVNQNVEGVGAHAARLLLRSFAGEELVPERHLVASSLITRESCGCLRDVTLPRSARRPQAVTPAQTPREQLAGRLRDEVLGAASGHAGDAEVAAACADLARIVEVVTRGDDVPVASIVAAVQTIYRAHPRGDTVAAVLTVVQDTVRQIRERTPGLATAVFDACVREIAIAFGDIRTRDEGLVMSHLQTSLRTEYDISMDLLRSHEHDPRSLRWLEHAAVPAGCLALWSRDDTTESGQLAVVSTFGPDLDRSIVGTTPAELFPPAQLIRVASRVPGSLTYLLPVKTEHRDWGLLAVVGPPEPRTATGRETYFQWAAMLSVALDHEAMLESLRTQREDLAKAYDRERALAESIRSSEERYVLAAGAANDGLWDWDLSTDGIYFSPRWKAMLGHDENSVGTDPSEWFSRVHPDDVEMLSAYVEACRSGSKDSLEHEHRMRARDGSYRWVLCRALAVPGGHRPATRLVGSMTDITERRELEQQLRQQALYDTLTGLPNRALFLDRLQQAVARAARIGAPFAVLFFDLDGFKVVNDSLGHMTGDLLLRHVADRLGDGLRATDMAARLGGDEFTVLLEDVADLADVPAVARKIQDRVSAPYELDGNTLVVSATVGVATSAIGYTRAEDALRDADIAMYRAKSTERGSCVVFDSSMHELAMSRLRIESELRHAVRDGDLTLHYQPIVRLDTDRVTGLEALIRWYHPDRGVLLPGEFLSITEETGLIVPIGRSILTQACAQLSEWRAAGVVPPDLTISLNVSNREFWHADLLEHISRSLRSAGLGPEWLTIEITEGVLMSNVEQARTKLQALHDLGLRIHVDDFGTGYSSLEALHRFPIDALKIDRSFVTRLEEDLRARELVRTIIMMGRGLDIDVIAEGVETRAQQQLLLDLGCRLGQGFLFAPALPAAAIGPMFALHPDSVAGAR